MNEVVAHTLAAALTALPGCGRIHVGFSGGLDSSVLVHALAALPTARARGLAAIHVDHAIHPRSAEWTDHCAGLAAQLDVPFAARRIPVTRDPDLGLEASARRVRHAAFASVMQSGDIIALAHHQGDQSETVLLKLLRGAGPEGLAGMRRLRPFGAGWLWRPLLDLPRAILCDYAVHHQLVWIDDPSNADPAIDRNFLRAEWLPRLRRRWPEADVRIARSAGWAQAAADFIQTEAESRLPALLASDGTLDAIGWLSLAEALRAPLLRQWLRGLGLPEPTHRQLTEFERQLRTAELDRLPAACWSGAELRTYRGRLHAFVPLRLPPRAWSAAFDGSPVVLPAGLGTLRLQGDSAPTIIPPLVAHFRRGGERLRPIGSPHTRDLRDLFQQAGVPPWQRDRLPMLSTLEGQLIAVADRWLDARTADVFPSGARLEWQRGR